MRTRVRLVLLAILVIILGIVLVRPPFGQRYSVLRLAQGKTQMSAQFLKSQVRLPPGFAIGLYAGGLPMVRFLRFTDGGDLLATQPRSGRVVQLLPDRNHDGLPDGRRVLLQGLDSPHGIDIHDGWLYVAEGSAVFRVRLSEEPGLPATVSGTKTYLVSDLPRGGNHWTRSLRIGPDDHMYVSIGSSCNVCLERDPRRAAILRYDLQGRDERIYATGLRNAVGMAFQPGTGRLYATDNGRDLLGDDFPPCELNLIVEGGFYGWPFANGDRVPDPDFGAAPGHEKDIARARPPVHAFRAHNAPLGIAFAEKAKFPERYRHAAFVALHGSWNRSKKDGYKVVALFFEPAGIREEDFATGFMQDEETFGRPVDVAVGPDGALYISDDYAGTIYRVTYKGP